MTHDAPRTTNREELGRRQQASVDAVEETRDPAGDSCKPPHRYPHGKGNHVQPAGYADCDECIAEMEDSQPDAEATVGPWERDTFTEGEIERMRDRAKKVRVEDAFSASGSWAYEWLRLYTHQAPTLRADVTKAKAERDALAALCSNVYVRAVADGNHMDTALQAQILEIQETARAALAKVSQ